MTSPESRPIDQNTQPLPTSAQIAIGRIAEIEAQQLPAGQKYQEIRNAIEPEGPYKSMRHRRETAEHIAHYWLSHPPVTNTVEAKQWVNGAYLSPTMHQLASRGDMLPEHEPYISPETGRRVVETLADVVMNDAATDNPVDDLNRIGETLTAPVIEARNEKLPEGAKLMAAQVINAVREIRQERTQETPTPTRETVAKTNDRPRVAAKETSRAAVNREAMLAGISHLRHRVDFRLLTQTTLNMSVQEIRNIGSNARQYVSDLVGRYGNKLPEWNKTQLIDAAKRTAVMSVQLAAQVPGVGDAVRDRLKAMVLRLESDEKNSTLAVGQELRDSINSRTNDEKLREFSQNPERATVEASQLIVEWSDRQLQAPLTPEQEATRQAYKELVNSIAVGVNGEKFFNGKLPELVAERQFRSAADRSVDRTVDQLRKVLAPVIVEHVKKGGEPARTAQELVERSGRATGAERALIIDQMVNLSPEEARKLEVARVSILDKMATERLDPKTLTADERVLHNNPRLLEADLTQRGARLTALSNQWARDGQWLNPENPADQHRAVARLAGNVAEGMTDPDRQQSELKRRSEELRIAAEKAAQQVIIDRETKRREDAEKALSLATPLHKSPGEDSQVPGRTQVLRPEGPTIVR